MSSDGLPYRISYGKAQIPLYRVYATPLAGLRSVPESPFVGRANIVLALRVDVESETDPRVKVYTNPFPALGLIRLTLSRLDG